jgi:hypothetical protein
MRDTSLRDVSIASGVPYATLHDQFSKPRFSLDVLLKVVAVLDLDIGVVLGPIRGQ